MHRKIKVLSRASIALLSCVFIASCGSAGGDSLDGASAGAQADRSSYIGVLGDQRADTDPVAGGKITFAMLSPVMSLDPTVTMPTGSTGASELIAIYDVLVRWDQESDTYVPQLAEDLSVSDDLKTWTLKLREGVTFSDGTPMDAAAVDWNIKRYIENHGLNSQLLVDSISTVETPDQRTVIFSLTEPWGQFWSMLAAGSGIMVAPSSAAGDQFQPIGAGPFVVDRFAPQEELALTPREGYWGGTPNLAKLRFVPIQGDQAKVEALASGSVNMAYLRTPEVVTAYRDGGGIGYQDVQSLGSAGLINNQPGRPGADVRVRRAMAYAIDPGQLDERINAGTGIPGSEMFMPWSRWHAEVPATTVDREKAAALLAEAKADGYDGRLVYTTTTDPAARDQALSLEAQLEIVGFDVEIDYLNNVTDLTRRVYVDHDFDFSRGGPSILDQEPYTRLFSNLNGDSPSNALGFADDEFDAALQNVKIAQDDDALRAALSDLQVMFNEKMPFLAWGAQSTVIAWDELVHGVRLSFDSIVLFDKAWVG